MEIQLQEMMHTTQLDSGDQIIHQSHKNHLKSTSLNVFMCMAKQYDILDQKNTPFIEEAAVKSVEDLFIEGFVKLRKDFAIDPYLS